MPILASFGALKRTPAQSRQNYSADFNNASYCGFSSSGLSPGSSNFSVEFFINMTAAPPSGGEDVVVDFGYTALTSGMRITVSDLLWVDARITTSTTTYFLSSFAPILTIGTWYYVAVSRVSGSTRLFVNTAQQSSQNITSSLSFPSNRFGAGVNSLTTSYLNGRVASFRYNIGSGFTSATVPTAPLVITAQTKILTFQTPTIINEVGSASPTSNTGVTVSQTGPF